ncbi:unnamed protein product [Acanthoscelides obtectus]|uniref:Uncharacterized protein n=1 Tax=Acanthoscelides obtectus TaxID=200917 RepID=A0A9P0L5L5_ACAOB|nr:unnamed protein product [Acanthoscelides obtectus]CAK1677722.1 hypothetical protein AOBTE_LOCUS31511 [Acanthoscelides obtectus]
MPDQHQFLLSVKRKKSTRMDRSNSGKPLQFSIAVGVVYKLNVSGAHIHDKHKTFIYSFETANGIKVDESGYLKDNPESSTDRIQVIEGSISYTDEGGHMINLRYVADENGYQPQGDHLPTAPPVPEGIARSVQGQSQQPNNSVQPGGQLSSQHPGNPQQQNEFAPQHAGSTQAQAQLTNGPQ